MPATLNLTDMKQIINKNPDTAQEAFETKLTEGYKKGTINIQMLMDLTLLISSMKAIFSYFSF